MALEVRLGKLLRAEVFGSERLTWHARSSPLASHSSKLMASQCQQVSPDGPLSGWVVVPPVVVPPYDDPPVAVPVPVVPVVPVL